MISVAQCAALAGLDSHDMVLGVTLSAKHQSLLSSYLFNLERGRMAVRDMIVADMRRFRELGALQRAADLLLVLRLFLTNYPDASRFQRRKGELRANGEAGGDGERVAAATTETTGNVIEFSLRTRHRSLSPRFGRDTMLSHPRNAR